MPSSRFPAVLSLMAATALLSLGAPDIAAAGSCKPTSITGSGSAKNNEPLARSRARDDWRDKAKAAHGPVFQHWIKAVNANVSCTATGRIGSRTWQCTALARPCS